MAGDWIKVEHVMPDKPEVSQLAEALGIDHDAVVGKLIRFWIWADAQSIDGNSLRVTASFIDRLSNCPGFAAALLKVGWLTSRDSRFSVPNFSRHNGQTAKARALTKDRVKRLRDGNEKRKSNAASVSPSSLSLSSDSLEVLVRNTEFESKEVLEALRDWCAHVAHLTGRVPGQIKLKNDLMEASRRKLTAEDLVRWIRFSIGIDAKNWKDPKDDWSKRPAPADGKPKTPDEWLADIKEAEKRAKQ